MLHKASQFNVFSQLDLIYVHIGAHLFLEDGLMTFNDYHLASFGIMKKEVYNKRGYMYKENQRAKFISLGVIKNSCVSTNPKDPSSDPPTL